MRVRQISSREAVLSCLERIDQVNPRLNALVELSPAEALARADAADEAVASGQPLGPLCGARRRRLDPLSLLRHKRRSHEAKDLGRRTEGQR